jgi:pimeloyl-ACP methyl ester carboxylesterase
VVVDQVRRNGLTFDVVTGGPSAGEAVVLLHGFPQGATMWDGVAAGLQQRGYRTLAPNQRGCSPGARPRGVRSYRLDELVADAAAVAEQLAGGPVHLVGHDWGGPVAWGLAAARPELVRSLTTISGPHLWAYLVSTVLSRQALASWYLPVFQIPGLVERLVDPTTPAGRRRFVRFLVHFGQDPAVAERDAVLLGRGGLAAGLAWYRAVPHVGFRRLARSTVSAPTLLLWGDRDNAVLTPGIEMSRRYATGPCRFEVLPGASHWAPDEAPDRLVALIGDHLAATGTAR